MQERAYPFAVVNGTGVTLDAFACSRRKLSCEIHEVCN